MTLNDLFYDMLNSIEPSDKLWYQHSKNHWDGLAKPLGALGFFEDAISRIAAVQGRVDVKLNNRVLLVFCADNGVICHNVSQSDETVTTAVAKALGLGVSTVCNIARPANCKVIPVDIGMKENPGLEGVVNCCVRRGTSDMVTGPAMTREECIQAILAGAELVRIQQEAGADVICLGEMGIGNTTTTSAVASVLLGVEPEELTGRGAGLSDEGLKNKVNAIRTAIAVNKPDPKDPIDVLAKVGGFDLCGICGAILGGAYYHVPIVLDGVITCAAALAAVRLCPAAADAISGSHVSLEPAAPMMLKEMGIQTYIAAGMHLGEGGGAVMLLPLLDQALSVYNSGHTFGNLGIDAYVPQT